METKRLCSSPPKAMLLVFMAFFCSSGTAAAPAMFIFGDSLVDNGNNNFIPSIARANYFPYGIDLGAPTGRFCNGLTVVDLVGKFTCMAACFGWPCFIRSSLNFWSSTLGDEISTAVLESFSKEFHDAERDQLCLSLCGHPRWDWQAFRNLLIVLKFKLNNCRHEYLRYPTIK